MPRLDHARPVVQIVGLVVGVVEDVRGADFVKGDRVHRAEGDVRAGREVAAAERGVVAADEVPHVVLGSGHRIQRDVEVRPVISGGAA